MGFAEYEKRVAQYEKRVAQYEKRVSDMEARMVPRQNVEIRPSGSRFPLDGKPLPPLPRPKKPPLGPIPDWARVIELPSRLDSLQYHISVIVDEIEALRELLK